MLLVTAHPDDESMGNGTAIVRHVAAGCEVHLLCVTRGGAGWNGLPVGRRADELPEIRARELEQAAAVLGLAGVELWDYPDGGVAGCDQVELTARIRSWVEALDPGLVLGWGPDGAYGHPDHIAVGACTDAALAGSGRPLYHLAVDRLASDALMDWFQRHLPESGMVMMPQDPVDLVLEPSAEESDRVRRAVECHQSQLNSMYAQLLEDPTAFYWLARASYVRITGHSANPAGPGATFPELS